MRPSYFVLYSAVATQAATALLLACALYVLGRYYPRWFLRLWAGAWLAESLHATSRLTGKVARKQPQRRAHGLPVPAQQIEQARAKSIT